MLGFHVLNSVIQLNMMVNRCFYVGIDVANDAAEDAGGTKVLLNGEISKVFDTS